MTVQLKAVVNLVPKALPLKFPEKPWELSWPVVSEKSSSNGTESDQSNKDVDDEVEELGKVMKIEEAELREQQRHIR